MAKTFLSGIRSNFLTDLDDPILPLDAANKRYVDLVSVPPGGSVGQVLTKLSSTNYDVGWADSNGSPTFGNSGMYFHGGTFTNSNNAILHGGSF